MAREQTNMMEGSQSMLILLAIFGLLPNLCLAAPMLFGAEGIADGNFDALLLPMSNLVGMGFVVWFAHHTVVKTLPKMQEQFSEDLRLAFEEVKKAREEFYGKLIALADAHNNCAAEQRAAVGRLSDALLQVTKTCAAAKKLET